MRTRPTGSKIFSLRSAALPTGASSRSLAAGATATGQSDPAWAVSPAALSDFVVLTSDNPRTEDPYAILRDVLPAILESRTPFAVIENRREAIGFALREAKARDVVVLCGKGHETYQEIGTIKYHLDEREVVRERFAQVQRKDAADAAKENEHEDHHCLHTELRGLRDHGKISGP